MSHPEKSWQEIAADMTAEKDLKRMIILAKHLQEAIWRERNSNLKPQASPTK